jgi:hypothetical protein
VHRGAWEARDLDPASISTLLGHELLLTQNRFVAGNEYSKCKLGMKPSNQLMLQSSPAAKLVTGERVAGLLGLKSVDCVRTVFFTVLVC